MIWDESRWLFKVASAFPKVVFDVRHSETGDSLAEATIAPKSKVAALLLDGSAAAARSELRLKGAEAPSNSFANRVAEAMRRFLLAAGPSADHAEFARDLSSAIVQAMRDAADDQLTVIAAGLLVGRYDEKKKEVVAEAGLLFDALAADPLRDEGFPVWHTAIAAAVSDLMQNTSRAPTDTVGIVSTSCALTGSESPLLSGPFPNPNLPTLGPTLLFSRNADTPSLSRYRQFDGTMPVARATAESLQAAAIALTLPHREGKTWRSIPGERPKQTDLMLAYVVAAPDAPVSDRAAPDWEALDPRRNENAGRDGSTRRYDTVNASAAAIRTWRSGAATVSLRQMIQPPPPIRKRVTF